MRFNKTSSVKGHPSYWHYIRDFLGTFLDLPNGIPSHDTFNRVFSAIDSKQFELCFIEWVKTLVQLIDKEIVAIDGKTIRGVKYKGKKSPIHMVSAFACNNNLVLGQVKTDQKSNSFFFQNAIRSHWAIENKLHRTLDVAFSEDASRKRTKNAAQNFSILIKIALNLLKKDSNAKVGIKSRRLKAAMNNQYMLKILKL